MASNIRTKERVERSRAGSAFELLSRPDGDAVAAATRDLDRDRPEPGDAEREPWVLPATTWNALEPDSVYARRLRTPVLYLVTLAFVPLAFVLAAPIALVNAWLYGGLGRVLFLQERVGRRGRVYVIYKFRTMSDGEGMSDQARVTRFGRFLRNSHLDELPQFLNILRGEMCLIGPRPEMLETERWANTVRRGFAERLVLRPGITGWAQIQQGYANCGDREGYMRKAALNRQHRRGLTFASDVAILVLTVLWMLRMKGWNPGADYRRASSRARS